MGMRAARNAGSRPPTKPHDQREGDADAQGEGRDAEGEGQLAEVGAVGRGRDAVRGQGQHAAEQAADEGQEHRLGDEGEEDAAAREAEGAQGADLAGARGHDARTSCSWPRTPRPSP